MVDREKNTKLLRDYYKGEKDNLYYIIENNLPLIFSIIKKFQNEFKISNEYIYSCVIEEFINGVNTYNFEKSATFENYVKTYVEVKAKERFVTTNYQYRIKK